RFDRTLHVALDDQREFRDPGDLELVHHLLEAGRTATGNLFADRALTIFGDFTRTGIALDDREAIACARHAVKAKNFDRNGRAGFLDLVALVVDEGANAGKLGAGNDDVADLERAAL